MTPRRTSNKDNSSDADSSGKTSPDLSGADTFPCKAFQVIQYCELNDPNIACWSRDGLYFMVKDTAVFSSSHLPRYFKHSNLQSFVRQLNIYGFRTVKEHDNSDGSVAFRHRFFQRERHDLLSNIKRANKKQNGSYNDRFDEMQQQMDVLSEKLDLLISLVTANNGLSPAESLVNTSHIPPFGAKRPRRDPEDSGLHVSQVCDTTVSTKAESFHSSSSGSSAKASLPTFSAEEKEQDALEGLGESIQDLDEIHQNAAILMDGDEDFKMMIDDVLGERGEESDGVSDLGRQDSLQSANVRERGEEAAAVSDLGHRVIVQDDVANDMVMDEDQVLENNPTENGNNTVMASDPLMSKVAPETVQGQVHMPQSTAVVTSINNDDDEYDEEAGTPFTTAVAVTPDVSHKWLGRRTKLFLAVLVLMVIAAFITWPVVVFGGAKGKNLHYSISEEILKIP